MKISLCMIVKNEEKYLERCLNSVKNIVDEIVIVDTGSSDKTVEIAKKFTNRIYFYKWHNDFAAARNFSFSKATNNYIMWLDADDIFSENQSTLFLERKKKLYEDFIRIKYITNIDSNGNIVHSNYRARIIKKGKYSWQGQIHEVIPVDYSDINSAWEEIEIIHSPNEYKVKPLYLNIFEEIKNKYTFGEREKFLYARELMSHNRNDEALEIFLEINQNEYYKNNAYYYIGKIFLLKKEFSKCLKFLIKIPNKNSDICYLIGDIYLEIKLYNQSIFWYQSAILDNENYIVNKQNGNLNAFIKLVYIYIVKKDYIKSSYYLNKAKKINPKNQNVINYEKYLIYMLGGNK
ncbi:MAG: glycosyltransferase family 2 protein [Cetobacterium sp.]|uniref:tetratricopeptide repeat-containing glycosyltransferase family 2 protein n=1 Tax=Cetobacterium sp. TaxID=2071632 RepID=UPI002FC624C1